MFLQRRLHQSFRRIYDHNYPIMQAMRELNIPLPKALAEPAEYALNTNLRRLPEAEDPDLDQLCDFRAEVRKWGFGAEKNTVGFAASHRLTALMEQLRRNPYELSLLTAIETMLRTLQAVDINLDLMKEQQLYFHIAHRHYQSRRERVETGDQSALEWVKSFDELGAMLRVRSG